MMFSFQTGSTKDSTSNEPRPKRAKISIACNVCKSRKTKCDGVRPVCGPCSKRRSQNNSQPCSYRQVDTSSLATTDSTTNSPEQPSHGRGLTNYARGNDEDETGFHGPTAPSSSLFGASGGLYIMNDIGNEKDRPATFERRIESTSQISPKKLNQLPRLQNTGPAKELSDMQYVIPPRKVADDLLDLYWDYVDSAYPWLDRPSIENAYEGLWTKDSEQSMNERALHCILNLMFATACVAFQGQPPLSRYQSSIVFFDRAQELMSYELKDLYNFEIIQMLLLTAVYLQHQKSPQKSFRSIGMAIHIAQELGLHIPETTEAMHDPRERDLARRVWNGCVILDRICSMTFGCALKVPQSISKQGLQPLMLSTMEMNPTTSTGAVNLPSKAKFYLSFCQLHHIIGDVLETFYIPNGSFKNGPTKQTSSEGALLFDKIATLFKIESELNDWASNLDPFFKKPSEALDTTPSKHITREANVLRARYLSVRLLLFRPLLSQIHQQSSRKSSGTSLYQDDQLLPHVVFQCQLSCTRAAEDMIEFITRNSPAQTQAYILPSNWYIVSYVYMAVTILLAAKASTSQIVAHFSASRLNGLLQQARDILREYEKHSTLALRCSSVLRLIEQSFGRHEQATEPTSAEHARHMEDHEDSYTQDGNVTELQPQIFPDSNMDMIERYTFDWNEWPVFFAELDEGNSSPEGGPFNLA